MGTKKSIPEMTRFGEALSPKQSHAISERAAGAVQGCNISRFHHIILQALVCVCCALSIERAYAQESRDSVRIHFRQGSAEIDMTLRGNRRAIELAVLRLTRDNAPGAAQFIRSVTIAGGASPEGSAAMNQRLSELRAQRLFDCLSRYRTFPDSLRHSLFLGRDWAGLLRRTEASDNVPHKAEVVALLREIIDNIARCGRDSEENLARLKRLRGGVPYAWLYKNLFPELRASCLYIDYAVHTCPTEPETAVSPSDDVVPVADTARTVPPVSSSDTPARPDSAKNTDSGTQSGPQDDSSAHSRFVEALEGNLSDPVACPPRRWWALKTNLVYDALLVPNIGVEFYLGRNWSVAGGWMYAWWKSDRRNHYWRTYGGELALRRWFGRKAKEKPLTGHHLGLYGQVFTYDFETGGRGYMGGKPGGKLWDKLNYAAGVEYGYALPIGRRLNLDFTIGIGYWGGTYHEYLPQDGHYVWQATKQRRWFGPTKAEISLVWLLGRGNVNQKGGRR